MGLGPVNLWAGRAQHVYESLAYSLLAPAEQQQRPETKRPAFSLLATVSCPAQLAGPSSTNLVPLESVVLSTICFYAIEFLSH